MAVIGIDLGTTNSLGAVYRNGEVELIPNRFGSFLTPSVVSVMEDGSVVVGKIARERLITHPELTVASFKKKMGTGKAKKLGKRSFLPEELSSFVIQSIVEDAKAYLNEEIEEAIISVPAYFHDKQRVATKRAGALAGVYVERIVNEPSAAAVASYFETGEEQLMMVFDFGGGTLDVSIVECFDTMVEILAVSGDNHLGGDNFHEIMVKSFLEEHHLTRTQVTAKEYAVLLRQAEKCKQMLSKEQEAMMSASIGGHVCQSVYTNDRLMEESAAILSRIREVIRKALKDSNLQANEINMVVMAGGSGKMPLIQSYIRHLFQRAPMVSANCDELIARGLGLICGVKTRDSNMRDYVLTDICPFTLGIQVNNEADRLRPYMSAIIPRNSMLPCSRVHQYCTASDNQKEILVQIRQGEHPYAEDNLLLGELHISVQPKKRGEETVDVRFTYDLNGILMVDVTILSTGETISKVISEEMDERELNRRMRALEKLKVHPKDLSENKWVLEKLGALYEEAMPQYRERIAQFIHDFEYLLHQQNERPIKKYREYLEGIISQLEQMDPFACPGDLPEWSRDDDGEEEDGWTDEEMEQNNFAPDEDDCRRNGNGGGGVWTS